MKISYLFLWCASSVVAAAATAVIDSSLKQRFLAGGGGEKQNVMVSFTQGIQPVIDQINSMSFPNDVEKRTALTNAQEVFANGAQAPLKTFLNTMGVKYESFWINNKMVVQNVDSRLVNSISNIPGVAKIEKEPVINLNPMRVIGEPEEFSRLTRQANSSVEWGIMKIRANQVWPSFRGKGIVVANIDTGVRVSHEALKENWRSEFGWFDAYYGLSRPYDLSGHGTHTMGTIVGKNGIGVAPDAKWIACRGCNSASCGGSQLMRCGQWVQCPYSDRNGRNKNCSMAPNVVSNSWGGGSGDTWYDDVIKSWQTSGIIPVFAIGNAGPNCNTANSPGDRPNVIAVGSTEKNDQISEFSSLGPSKNGTIKPDIAAPGGKIRSAWYTSDTAYNTISGTSMACPHVSGVVALMKQKNGALKYPELYDIITTTTTTRPLNITNAKTCDNTSPSTYPNNVFGYGLVDALNAIEAVCGGSIG